MPHVNDAIEKVCRICHATAPKTKLKKLKIIHSNYFLIAHNPKECICSDCEQKYENYKQSSFLEVGAQFGYFDGTVVPDVTHCSIEFKCLYCVTYEEWRIIEVMPEGKDKRKAERDYFRNLLDTKSNTLAKTPLVVKDEPQYGFFRLEYRQLKTNFIYCEPCDKILNYTNSNNRGLRSHQSSQEHGRNSPRNSQETPETPVTPIDQAKKELSKAEIAAMRQIIAECFAGKLSTYYLESEAFNDAMKRILDIAGVCLPLNQSLTGSRQTLHRIAEEKASQIKNKTISDIAIANQQNYHMVITLDDGQLNNGNRENLRTFQAQYMDSEGQLNRRYLTSFDVLEKNAASLKQSLDKVKADFGIGSYSLCSDGASANLSLARIDGDTQINLCSPHGINNAAEMATTEAEEEDEEFKKFNKTVRKFLEKSSRCKFNQKFLHHEGWVKLKAIANTRWDSFCTSLESILHNYDILKDAGISHDLITKYSKCLIQQYYDLILPMRQTNQKMQLTTQTSGHLVAPSYHQLLVQFAHFAEDSSKAMMLRRFANKLVNNINARMVDGGRKQNRVNLDRVLQAAFYPPSGYLSVFDAKVNDEELQSILKNRVKNYEEQIKNWARAKSNESSLAEAETFDVSHTALEFEIIQYVNLARTYSSGDKTKYPQILKDFDDDIANKRDANARFWYSSYCKQHLPHLQAEISKLLAIPASTSIVEGTFSVANQLRSAKRSRLTTENLNTFLTCHYSRVFTPSDRS